MIQTKSITARSWEVTSLTNVPLGTVTKQSDNQFISRTNLDGKISVIGVFATFSEAAFALEIRTPEEEPPSRFRLLEID